MLGNSEVFIHRGNFVLSSLLGEKLFREQTLLLVLDASHSRHPHYLTVLTLLAPLGGRQRLQMLNTISIEYQVWKL